MTIHDLRGRERFGLTVAANIRAATARAGFNQSDLARKLGWSSGTVSIKWKGARQWSLEDIDAVADVLGVSPIELCLPPEAQQSPALREVLSTERARRDLNPQPSDLEFWLVIDDLVEWAEKAQFEVETSLAGLAGMG